MEYVDGIREFQLNWKWYFKIQLVEMNSKVFCFLDLIKILSCCLQRICGIVLSYFSKISPNLWLFQELILTHCVKQQKMIKIGSCCNLDQSINQASVLMATFFRPNFFYKKIKSFFTVAIGGSLGSYVILSGGLWSF